VIFLLKYHQNPQETEHRKKEEEKERKRIKKEKEKKKKKKKAPRVSSNKGEVNILRGEKYFNFKIFFLMSFHFLPLDHTILKTPSKIIEKVFLTRFRPSFSLTIYIT
jgi:predicted Holliday junction resolvase-like endonuclease